MSLAFSSIDRICVCVCVRFLVAQNRHVTRKSLSDTQHVETSKFERDVTLSTTRSSKISFLNPIIVGSLRQVNAYIVYVCVCVCARARSRRPSVISNEKNKILGPLRVLHVNPYKTTTTSHVLAEHIILFSRSKSSAHVPSVFEISRSPEAQHEKKMLSETG